MRHVHVWAELIFVSVNDRGVAVGGGRGGYRLGLGSALFPLRVCVGGEGKGAIAYFNVIDPTLFFFVCRIRFV